MSLSRTGKEVPLPRVEINIVSLVDVAFVVLIIFMITATFAKSAGMSMELPSSSAAQRVEDVPRELVIGISAEGRFVWDGRTIRDEELLRILQDEATQHGTKSRVTIQGDTHAEHGRVVAAMTHAQEAGFSQLVIATRLVSGETDAR